MDKTAKENPNCFSKKMNCLFLTVATYYSAMSLLWSARCFNSSVLMRRYTQLKNYASRIAHMEAMAF